VTLTAPGAGRLKGTASRTGKVVARGGATTKVAGRRTVMLKFTVRARRALRRTRRVPLTLMATYTPPRGVPISQRLEVTLER
jgi:hypothetical protein